MYGRVDALLSNIMWHQLEFAFKDVLQTPGPYNHSWSNLYRLGYDMVLHRHGEQLYNGLKEVFTENLQKTVRPRVIASSDRNFLQTIFQVWAKFQAAVKSISDCLFYMDRNYVKKNKLESSRELGLNLFREQILNHEDIRDRIKTALSGLTNEGETIDFTTVDNVCQMMMDLGLVL